jgi:hypothetical protein
MPFRRTLAAVAAVISFVASAVPVAAPASAAPPQQGYYLS